MGRSLRSHLTLMYARQMADRRVRRRVRTSAYDMHRKLGANARVSASERRGRGGGRTAVLLPCGLGLGGGLAGHAGIGRGGL